jgi:hypothetical protein
MFSFLLFPFQSTYCCFCCFVYAVGCKHKDLFCIPYRMYKNREFCIIWAMMVPPTVSALQVEEINVDIPCVKVRYNNDHDGCTVGSSSNRQLACVSCCCSMMCAVQMTFNSFQAISVFGGARIVFC